MHDTEGPFASSVSWLQNSASQASSHYIIRSSDGFIKQLVREKDRAWHARSWNNVMLGVEHEGYVSNPAYFTEAMYQSSAALFRHFVDTYGIPVDTFRIIGHYQHLKTWWVNWINNSWNHKYPQYKVDPLDNSHTDPGKYWNWSHYFDLITAGATTPSATGHLPASSNDSIWANSSIEITFDQPMSETESENAFSISPEINGSFTWEDKNQTMIFTPTDFYQPATTYKVTLDTNALSVLKKPIVSSYSFDFATKPKLEVKIADSYPSNNQKDISPTVKIMVNFNIPLIDRKTLGGKVEIRDSAGNSIGYKNAFYAEIDNRGFISFELKKVLDYSAAYKIILKSGIETVNNNSLASDTVINFTTAANNFEEGAIVDSFVNVDNWIQPKQNSNSSDLDTSLTSFEYLSGIKTVGNGSGQLNYAFSDTGGICLLEPSPYISLGTDSASKFGIWIYGDLSYNQISFKFENASNKTSIINSDTLSWTGWRFIDIPFDSINLSGEIFLSGITIKNKSSVTNYPAGSLTGSINLDGIQVYNYNQVTGVKDKKSTVINDYKLYQNYPNPFNPSTTIQYQIPKDGFVSLKIYNIIGQEVATLVNHFEKAGSYKANFDATSVTGGLSSGIYFYTLKAGEFNKTNKFVLLK